MVNLYLNVARGYPETRAAPPAANASLTDRCFELLNATAPSCGLSGTAMEETAAAISRSRANKLLKASRDVALKTLGMHCVMPTETLHRLYKHHEQSPLFRRTCTTPGDRRLSW